MALAVIIAGCSPTRGLYDQIKFPDDWEQLRASVDNVGLYSFVIKTDVARDGLSEAEWLSAVIEQVDLPPPYDEHDLQPTEIGARQSHGLDEYIIFVAPRDEPCDISFAPGPNDSDVAFFLENEIGPGWEDVLERTLVVGVGCE